MHAIIDLPEMEILDGLAERKMNPKRPHARVQGALYRLLWDAAATRGELNLEWRCRLGAIDGSETVLIPDLAFFERSRLDALAVPDLNEPPLSPDVAIEIRSPKESARRREAKVEKYLALGTALVLDVDPDARTIRSISPSGIRVFGEGEMFEDPTVPWMTFPVARAFEDLPR